MAKQTTTTYTCEKCNKELPGFHNSITIRTHLREAGYWSRLDVAIIHRHGLHNDGKEEDADLCQNCAIELLEDAVKRIKAGERATKGTESTEQEGWNSVK